MKPTVITLTGPTCSGKSTIEKALHNLGHGKTVSATTRAPRYGEKHEVDYYFMPRRDFEAAREFGAIVEYVEYSGNLYGTFEDGIYKALEHSTSNSAVIVCEPIGVKSIAEWCEERQVFHLPVFVYAPADILMQRYMLERVRGTDTTDVSVLANHAARLACMFDTESKWVLAAYCTQSEYSTDLFRDYTLRVDSCKDDATALAKSIHAAVQI